MMRFNSDPMGHFNMRPMARPAKRQIRFAGPGSQSVQKTGGIQHDAIEFLHRLHFDETPENRPPLNYRVLSPFRRIEWANLTDDPHHCANEKAIYALMEDLRDRKNLFKVHKSANFKKAVSLLNEAVSYHGKGAARTEKLHAAEVHFVRAAAEFPFQYLKAEAYQAAGLVAKILGKPTTQVVHYLERAKHHYDLSGDEIQSMLQQNELNSLDTARVLIGIVPSVTEWLFRMASQSKPSLKPNQTLSARILMPVSKMTNTFHAEEMESHRQNSDIPQLFRQLTHSQKDEQSLDFMAY